MKIALAQLNPRIADFAANLAKAREACARARREGAELLVFPECFLTGYPPRDLLDRADFMGNAVESVKLLARESKGLAIVVGTPWPNPSKEGRRLINAAALLRGGKVEAVYAKTLLPQYDIFDEMRWFEPAAGGKPPVFRIGKIRIGVTICEDLWDLTRKDGQPLYFKASPVKRLMGKCDLLLNLAASPYDQHKYAARRQVFREAVRRTKVPLLYVNQCGGQDELVFDGRSLVLDAKDRVAAQAAPFQEEILFWDSAARTQPIPYAEDEMELLHQALVTGIRDYFQKTGFSKAVVGLSGGIDSAVVAALASEALGPSNVTGVTMPSHYSSEGSVSDSRQLAENLGIAIHAIPISELMRAFDKAVLEVFRGPTQGLTHENLQSRIRGVLLMAFSNRENSLVLNTGNKSELSMGYCTLYGDLNGAVSILGDLYKTRIYRLVAQLNARKELIPRAIIEKAPSAELRPDQKDTDSLPPYPVLDGILEAFLEERLCAEEIIERLGHPADLVHSVLRKVPMNEYKRRQAPPVFKVTPRAFGPGWRQPLARKI
ncbi:MAG: NAD+ synthase [Spirochaetes bacterium]|nr:NAD+ synthase [Spirochaetota bacterium]